MMEIDVDIGNSRIKWRTRSGAGVGERGIVEPVGLQGWLEALPWETIARVNIASVAGPDLTARIADFARQHAHVQLFQAQTGTRFGRLQNGYHEPRTLGVDRWLAMIGALERAQGAHCVISCGTAITIDFVSAEGRHQGGYIIPGLSLQRRMLMQGTHAVRPDDDSLRNDAPGHSTAECAMHGIWAVLRSGVQGILAACAENERTDEIFLTGGDAQVLLADLLPGSVVVPDLVLDGLAALASKQN